jgi:hypothetical protein
MAGLRITRRVAIDRVISTVDADARHGHHSSAWGFNGYKSHAAVDPDWKIITGATAGPAGGGDAAMTEALLDDLVCDEDDEADHDDEDASSGRPVVYGDAAYGSGDNLELLARLGAEPMVKTQPAVAPGGQSTKDDFDVDLAKRTVTCPNAKTMAIGDRDAAKVQVRFAEHCTGCPLRSGCTRATEGRTITIGRGEQRLPRRPRPSARPVLAGQLPSEAAEGRTQTRAPALRTSRRPTGAHAWPSTNRSGLEAARWDGQPRPSGP